MEENGRRGGYLMDKGDEEGSERWRNERTKEMRAGRGRKTDQEKKAET